MIANGPGPLATLTSIERWRALTTVHRTFLKMLVPLLNWLKLSRENSSNVAMLDADSDSDPESDLAPALIGEGHLDVAH